MVSFVVAENRVDVVDLVVDLVDVDLDLADVVSLSSSCIFIFWPLGPWTYFKFSAPAVFYILPPGRRPRYPFCGGSQRPPPL